MRKRVETIRKGWKLTVVMLLLCGLTACANPLTGVVEVAIDSFSETMEDTEGEDTEAGEMELRKIEPGSQSDLEYDVDNVHQIID